MHLLDHPWAMKDRCYITEGASQGHGSDQGYASLTDNQDPKHPIGFSIMHCHTQGAMGQDGSWRNKTSICEGSKTQSGTFCLYGRVNVSVYGPYNQIFITDKVFWPQWKTTSQWLWYPWCNQNEVILARGRVHVQCSDKKNACRSAEKVWITYWQLEIRRCKRI